VAVEKDQYVNPGAVAVTLADDSELEIQVPIDSRDARRWLRFRNTSETATNAGSAWFDNLEPVVCAIHWTEQSDDIPWRGQLDRVVEFDPQTRTLTVAVRIDAPAAVPPVSGGLPLVEGMFCRVDIPGRTLARAVRLPRWAVSYEGTAYVVQDGRLRTTRVMVNHTEGDFSFVTDGITAGQIVITTRLIDPLENSLVAYLDEPVASNDLLAAAK
jgi:hypothetical protein